MTKISEAAETARETARQATGEFGKQEHSAPDVQLAERSIGGTRVLEASGEPVPVVLWHAPYEGYVPMSLAEAREGLHIPASEPDEVVLAAIHLLSKQDDEGEPPYVDWRDSYENPGDDALIPTTEWSAPALGLTWDAHVDAWRSDDESDPDQTTFVRGGATFTLESVGYSADESATAEAIALSKNVTNCGDEVEILDDGRLRFRAEVHMPAREFTPRLVERALASEIRGVDPRETLRHIRREGIVIKDSELQRSRELDGRALAYAAGAGLKLTDADAVAIARAFDIPTTLRDGYYAPKGYFPDDTPKAAKDVLNKWGSERMGKNA